MNRLLALTVATVLVVGCTGDGPDPAPTSTTASTIVTTHTVEGGSGTATTRTTSSPPTTETVAERTACARIPDNSEAVFEPSSGIYAAFVAGFESPTGPLSFDVVQWLTGEQADAAYIEEYGGDDGPPNGYHVKNENALVRDAPVATDAAFWIVQLDVDSDADVDRTDAAGFAAALAGGYEFDLYWLTFEDGTITEICQQYVP